MRRALLVLVVATSLAAAASRRGMEVNIFDHTPYDRFTGILGDTNKENKLHVYSESTRIDHWTLLNLDAVLPARTPDLRSLISRARARGVSTIDAKIQSTSLFDYARIVTYQNLASDWQRFDGIVYDVDFWTGGEGPAALIAAVAQAKASPYVPTGRQGRPFTFGAWVSNASSAEWLGNLSTVFDHVIIKDYVTDAHSAYTEALPALNAALDSTTLTAYVALSAQENVGLKSYIVERGFGQAESTFLFGITTREDSKLRRFGGFQWFNYMHCALAVNETYFLDPTTFAPYSISESERIQVYVAIAVVAVVAIAAIVILIWVSFWRKQDAEDAEAEKLKGEEAKGKKPDNNDD